MACLVLSLTHLTSLINISISQSNHILIITSAFGGEHSQTEHKNVQNGASQRYPNWSGFHKKIEKKKHCYQDQCILTEKMLWLLYYRYIQLHSQKNMPMAILWFGWIKDYIQTKMWKSNLEENLTPCIIYDYICTLTLSLH